MNDAIKAMDVQYFTMTRHG